MKQDKQRRPLRDANGQAERALSRIRWDALSGMPVSNIVARTIMLGTAATLHAAGKQHIGSAADAARALRPSAGDIAFAVFSVGIIGTGLLALASSSAYAAAGAAGWKASLERKPRQPKAFYAVIALSMGLVMAIDWFPFI
jgi:Mn2+ and Fe2+ transporters of the NRAMP family